MILSALEQLCIGQPEWEQHYQDLQTAKSLTAMVCIALQIGLFIARLVVQETLSHRATQSPSWGECPTCGHRLQSKGWQSRQMETLIGKIH
jgi:hypothetical protein